jgi:hypothetical protein
MEAYVDGELSVEETSAFEVHLAACAGCRRALADRQDFRSVVRAQLDLAAPPGLEAAILSAVRGSSPAAEGARAVDLPGAGGVENVGGAGEAGGVEGGGVVEGTGGVEAAGGAEVDGIVDEAAARDGRLRPRGPGRRVRRSGSDRRPWDALWPKVWRLRLPALAGALVVLLVLFVQWRNHGSGGSPEAAFSRPAVVVVLRYHEGPANAGKVELGGLVLGEPFDNPEEVPR